MKDPVRCVVQPNGEIWEGPAWRRGVVRRWAQQCCSVPERFAFVEALGAGLGAFGTPFERSAVLPQPLRARALDAWGRAARRFLREQVVWSAQGPVRWERVLWWPQAHGVLAAAFEILLDEALRAKGAR